MKSRGLAITMVLIFGAIALAGCTAKGDADGRKDTQMTTQQAKAKKSKPLWNYKKDKRLGTYMRSFAAVKDEMLDKYDGKGSVKTSTSGTYPEDFSKAKVAGSKSTIGWEQQGLDKYDYNVVAIYDYHNKDLPIPVPLTYFFAFHDHKPVVLVCDTESTNPQLREADGPDLEADFDKIAKNKTVKDPTIGNVSIDDQQSQSNNQATSDSESAQMDSNDTETVTDPKLIGIMVFSGENNGGQLSDDIPSVTMYSLDDNKYEMDVGNAASEVSYQIDGDNVNYWLRDPTSADVILQQTKKEYTISLSELISKYYSTPEQKQIVRDAADNIQEG